MTLHVAITPPLGTRLVLQPGEAVVKSVSRSNATSRSKARKASERRDFLTPAKRSELMRSVRSTNTSGELLLGNALNNDSLKFEANADDLPGKPDIVFRKKKLVIFVDGDFWHGNQWRKRGLKSLDEQFSDADKRKRWTTKISGNVARDFSRTAQLLTDGWTVIRFWESDIEKNSARCVDLVRQALRGKSCGSSASMVARRREANCNQRDTQPVPILGAHPIAPIIGAWKNRRTLLNTNSCGRNF